MSLTQFLLFSFVVVWDIFLKHETNELQKFSGRLEPGSEPTPSHACISTDGANSPAGDDADATVILIGDNAIMFANYPHHIVSARRRDGEIVPVLTVDKHEAGYIFLRMDIRSPNGEIIARLNQNGFIVNSNNILQMIRPDKSTLRVVDKRGDTALNVRVLNSRAILLDGVLSLYGRRVLLGDRNFRRACLKGRGAGDILVSAPW